MPGLRRGEDYRMGWGMLSVFVLPRVVGRGLEKGALFVIVLFRIAGWMSWVRVAVWISSRWLVWHWQWLSC